MNNPFEYFSEIYCINLDERTDRLEHAMNEFSKAGINRYPELLKSFFCPVASGFGLKLLTIIDSPFFAVTKLS